MKSKIQFIALALASVALTFSSCKKNDDSMTSSPSEAGTPDISEQGTNPDDAVMTDAQERSAHAGFLYTESNAAGQNSILCYRQHGDGSLTLEATVPSGGAGAGVALGSQGSIAIDHGHQWLFAVNAGDNTISSFAIANDGSLTLEQTVGTWGTMPISLTCHGDLLYVVNSMSDNISGFRIGAGGALSAIGGSVRSLSGTGTGPAQIAFTPNGNYLYVSEKMTNKITAFHLDAIGVAGVGTSMAATGMTPFGFDFARDQYLVISNAAGGAAHASTCTSYNGINSGSLSAVNGEVANNQSASCWVATTKFGRFAYVTNTQSDNISSYYVAPWGSLYLVHAAAVATGSHPSDICVAANNYYVYNINGMSHSISGNHRKILGDLESIGTTANLPEFAAGLVAW